MNPEYTSWKEMVREAEYQELAENVDVRDAPHTSNNHGGNKQNKKGGSDGKDEGNSKGSGSSSNHKKSHNFHGRKTNKTAGGSPHRSHGGNSNQNSNKGGSSKGGPSKRKDKDKHQSSSLSKEEKEELRAAGKCFNCGSEGHFARNCPENSKSKTSNGKPPGISANSIRFQDDQSQVNSLEETTLHLGMMRYSMPEIGKEYDSDGDTIPNLDSVSNSSEDNDGEFLVTEEKPEPEFWYERLAGKFEMTDDEILNEGPLLLSAPMKLKRPYRREILDGQDKLRMVEKAEGEITRLGDPVINKISEFLEMMQPYPGDPVNILQYRERRFYVGEGLSGEILVHDYALKYDATIERKEAIKPQFCVGD
ncbi:hypothetical protein H0H93_012847, partial [Arthromyces matolae]